MSRPTDPFTGYNGELTPRARQLRRRMTREERHLWYDFLRTYPVKIYRQRAVDRYIVDFYCSPARLVIELDGSQHYTTEGAAYDAIRSDVLLRHGLEVIRFTNTDINRRFDSVCQAIDLAIRQRMGL